MVKKMKNAKRVTAIVATLVLASLIASSPFLVFSNSPAPTSVKAAAGFGSDYGDVTQYEWQVWGSDESLTRSSAGPAPDRPDVLWTFRTRGLTAEVTGFNGKIFALNSTTLHALDPSTGQLQWRASIPDGIKTAGATGGATKIDDNYLFVDINTGIACYRIATGEMVWAVRDYPGQTLPAFRTPGGGAYFAGAYSSELKMKYLVYYNETRKEGAIIAYDLSDPSSKPPLAWKHVVDEPSELLCCGDEKLFVGSQEFAVYALDGKNGTLLWRSQKVGLAGYSGTYYNGVLYHSASSTRLTAYNATTGEILWDNDYGGRAFFAYGMAVAYGRIYDKNIDPSGGFVGCWDAETGELLWKAPAWYRIAYVCPAVADGKVYVTTCDQPAGSITAGLVMPGYQFTCFDAFTGTLLWRIPRSISLPSVAYGNLYFVSSATVFCIGSSKPPKPWLYFRGNTDNPGVAVGQSAPEDISYYKWKYTTNMAVTSSPAVVDGRVYIGSHDQNLYCLDAYTGSLIWKFPTEFRVMSSPAVVGGRVYTGADDGYIYCLDAKTGEQKWKVNLYGGNVPPILFMAIWQARSSPVVIGDRLWVGALDGKVYCLNTQNGNVVWTYQTGGPIGGSPTVSGGVVYIASTDRYVYALDAANGNFKWRTESPGRVAIGIEHLFLFGTPAVAEGKVFIGGGVADYAAANIIFLALNATTGQIIWNIRLLGNTQPVWTPTYFKGVLYISEYMRASARNATNGAVIWQQWLGHEVYSSVAYADDLRGPKVYVGCDTYSVTCLNATSGKSLSVYTTGAQVESSPAIYDGKLYVGSADGNVYCFDDQPQISTPVVARLSDDTINLGESVTVTANIQVPNMNATVTFVKPDGSQVNLAATTNEKGVFTASYTPDVAGDWSVTAWWSGYKYYTYAYSTDMPLKVASTTTPTPPTTPTPTPTPTPAAAAIPTEVVYAGAAIAAIVIVAAAGYMLRKKKPPTK